MNPAINRLRARIENWTATVGVCGMGYVGLPLAAAAAKAGFTLIDDRDLVRYVRRQQLRRVFGLSSIWR